MNNELNSVEDIDAMLDENYSIVDESENTVDTEVATSDVEETVSETEETVNNTEETVESADENSLEQDNEEATEEKADSEKPISKDDKQEYSFARLRKENADLKQQIKTNASSNEILEKMATQYGYDSVEKFTEAYEKARIIQEAKQKGYDPELYSKLQESNRRIEALEKENQEVKFMERANNFKSAVEKIVSDYSLGDEGRNDIFNRLEDAGYTVETILNLPNPEILVKGVIADKIAESSKQKQIEKIENLSNLVDDKHDTTQSNDKLDLDSLIASEMKEYRKANFYE